MGLNLSKSRINELDSCIEKPLLAYLRPPFGARCFPYPRLCLEHNQLSYLENTTFQDDGYLPLIIKGTTSYEMREDFDDIVIMKVNTQPQINENYGEYNDRYDYVDNSRYISLYDPTYNGKDTAVELTALRDHRLSSAMMQVLDIQETSIDFSKVNSATIHMFEDQSIPQTKFILVSQIENDKKSFYGPFEYKIEDNGEIKISGSNSYDFYVAGFDESSFDFLINIVNDRGNITAHFIDAEEFEKKLYAAIESAANSSKPTAKGSTTSKSAASKSKSAADSSKSASKPKPAEKVFDWIPNKDVIDIIGRVAKSSTEIDFSKKKVQALKRGLSECQEATLTPTRKAKILSVVENFDSWQNLSESAKKEKIIDADASQLAEFVFKDENFGDFYNKVIEHEKNQRGRRAEKGKVPR